MYVILLLPVVLYRINRINMMGEAKHLNFFKLLCEWLLTIPEAFNFFDVFITGPGVQ